MQHVDGQAPHRRELGVEAGQLAAADPLGEQGAVQQRLHQRGQLLLGKVRRLCTILTAWHH